MVDLNSLSDITRERLKELYKSVREIIMEDKNSCNNWIKNAYFDNTDTGFTEFVENVALAVQQGDFSWYEEDEFIIDWCCRSLRIADFIYKPD